MVITDFAKTTTIGYIPAYSKRHDRWVEVVKAVANLDGDILLVAEMQTPAGMEEMCFRPTELTH